MAFTRCESFLNSPVHDKANPKVFVRDVVAEKNVDSAYRWIAQDCPVCEQPPTKRLGRRGGSAHRAGLGIECEIWRCRGCGLVFPNPMPMPVGGLEQHYNESPDEYFKNHQPAQKDVGASALLRRAEALTKGKGRLLDVGAGRGELLRAALREGWEPTGIDWEPTSKRGR